MKILKASAGSGKTYALTREYILHLLTAETPDAYRHILAVTFTNKATDEMKRRILSELYTLSTAPEKSPYYNDLVPAAAYDAAELRSKAYRQLTGILHDYSSFAVSTIDRFFQQTLRAFSREIGQFASYQVELDKDALVDDAVTSVLNGLSTNNRALLDWVVKGVKADLNATGRFTLDKRLKDIARSIVTEDPKDTQYDWNQLEELKQTCNDVIIRFVDDVHTAVNMVSEAITSCHLDPADTNRGFIKGVFPFSDVNDREFITGPSASFREKALDPEKWFAKTKSFLLDDCIRVLGSPLEYFCSLFDDRYREYTTAFTIRSQVYSLGMAAELRKAFVSAQKEKGVISIEDTNTILHGIIDGTDSPFLYEKLGVRFEDFLLDEFQDTSRIQWDNFRPLIENSEAEGHHNLVVGDVKQSIYRWRGSDWNLLGSEIQNQLHVADDDVKVLDSNYRTCKAIVEFNNAFFPYAARCVDAQIDVEPAAVGSVSSIYGDVAQQVRTKNAAEGSVDICFVKDSEAQMKEIIDGINEVLSLGGQHGDIAILVRGNAEGAEIASRLIDEGIPVISDDSLYVKSSVTVRRLISQLSLVDNPARGEGRSVAGYLASEMHISFPEQYHTIIDLSETILSELKTSSPQLFESEVPFVQAFMDWLQEWISKNGNNLGAMLRDWAEAEPKIASPENSRAVRVMTVHKSKGLEFPYVIFPFAEKVTLFKPTTYWCKPDVRGTALENTAIGRYRTSLSDGSMNSCFRDEYVRERAQQAVDNINVFYVAMTRAKYGLKVIASTPSKSFSESMTKSGTATFKNLSQILYAYCDSEPRLFVGQPYDYSSIDRSVEGPKPMTVDYSCQGGNVKKRMVFRTTPQEAEPTLF